jgi:hypothetical protein
MRLTDKQHSHASAYEPNQCDQTGVFSPTTLAPTLLRNASITIFWRSLYGVRTVGEAYGVSRIRPLLDLREPPTRWETGFPTTAECRLFRQLLTFRSQVTAFPISVIIMDASYLEHCANPVAKNFKLRYFGSWIVAWARTSPSRTMWRWPGPLASEGQLVLFSLPPTCSMFMPGLRDTSAPAPGLRSADFDLRLIVAWTAIREVHWRAHPVHPNVC